MIFRTVLFLFSILLFLSYPSFKVYSEENDFGFRVEPIFPESQIGNKGYYHFKGKANETVTLQAKVVNESEKQLKVVISSLNAYSGNQGIIYQSEPILEGSSITDSNYIFTKFIKKPKEVILEPFETEIVVFTVKVPPITGTLLGSIEFKVFKGTEQLTKKEENSQLLIDQYRAVNLGVQVDVTEYRDKPSLILGKPHYAPEQISFMVPVTNNHPVIIPNIKGTYKITKDEDDSSLLTGEIPLFKIAPMTTFHYPIKWTKGTLEPGIYHVSSTLDVNGTKQNYEQTLTIKNKELQETQEKMEERGEIEIAPKTFPWTTFIIIVLVLLVLVLLWMMKRSKNA